MGLSVPRPLRSPRPKSPKFSQPTPYAPASSTRTANTSDSPGPSSSRQGPPQKIPPATPPRPGADSAAPPLQISSATSPTPHSRSAPAVRTPRYPAPVETPSQTAHPSRVSGTNPTLPSGNLPARAQIPRPSPAATISESPKARRPTLPGASIPG